MEIHSSLINAAGQRLETLFKDIDSFNEYKEFDMKGVHSYCFYNGKLVIVYSDAKGYWTPPGGGIEKGESVEEAAVREILEETNMRVLAQRPIGLLVIHEDSGLVYQARTACIVEPIGPFEVDPDGDVTEIHSIDPAEITKYFDWGETGAHQLARALELRDEMNGST